MWFTAGVTSLCSMRSTRRSVWKLDTPIARAVPSRLHRAPRAVDVAERLVDEVQIDVVQAQSLQGGGEGALRGFSAGVLHPELGGHEQLFSGDAARGDRTSDCLLVALGGGGVQRPVARREGVAHGLLGLVNGDLVDAEAEDRHRYAVVQSHLGYVGSHDACLSLCACGAGRG
jgi:hypothetical protein